MGLIGKLLDPRRKERRGLWKGGRGVLRTVGMVSMKLRGDVLCGRPCREGGCAWDGLYGLYGAGCGLVAPVSWSVQFLEFSFCLSGLSL